MQSSPISYVFYLKNLYAMVQVTNWLGLLVYGLFLSGSITILLDSSEFESSLFSKFQPSVYPYVWSVWSTLSVYIIYPISVVLQPHVGGGELYVACNHCLLSIIATGVPKQKCVPIMESVIITNFTCFMMHDACACWSSCHKLGTQNNHKT